MLTEPTGWRLLIYKIPTEPSRLRLQIWRKLHRMGAVYLQDAVCVVPSRPALDENIQYIAGTIEEMGGTYHLFKADTILPGGDQRLTAEFRKQADSRFEEILERLDIVQASLDGEGEDSSPSFQRAEEELKRERTAYLRARQLAYFGSDCFTKVEARLDSLKSSLDKRLRKDS